MYVCIYWPIDHGRRSQGWENTFHYLPGMAQIFTTPASLLIRFQNRGLTRWLLEEEKHRRNRIPVAAEYRKPELSLA